MSVSLELFRTRVRVALARPETGSLAACFPAPLVTALVVDAGESEGLQLVALDEVVGALTHVGVPRGRQFVLVGGDAAGPLAAGRAAVLHARLGVPVLVHDPAGAGFVAGRLADGTMIEFDDELREAEAIVTVGAWSASNDGPRGGAALLCPGVACAATREAYAAARARDPAAAWAFALAAEQLAPVDLSLAWDGAGEVVAASGRHAFAAQARVAGVP